MPGRRAFHLPWLIVWPKIYGSCSFPCIWWPLYTQMLYSTKHYVERNAKMNIHVYAHAAAFAAERTCRTIAFLRSESMKDSNRHKWKKWRKKKKIAAKLAECAGSILLYHLMLSFFFHFTSLRLPFQLTMIFLSLSLSQSFRFYIKVVTRCRQRRRISAECARAASLWHRTVSVDRAFGALVLFFSTFCNHSSFTLTQLHTRSAKPSLSLSLSSETYAVDR